MESNSLANQMYSGTASFGRAWAVIQAIFSTIFGIVLIIVGVYILSYRYKLKTTIGQVLENSSCQHKIRNDKNETICTSTIDYEIDDKNYTRSISTGSTEFTEGNDIKIWYSPNKPGEPEYDPVSPWVGWTIIIVGVLIILGSWLWVWLTRTYKVAAAAQGVKGVVSMFK